MISQPRCILLRENCWVLHVRADRRSISAAPAGGCPIEPLAVSVFSPGELVSTCRRNWRSDFKVPNPCYLIAADFDKSKKTLKIAMGCIDILETVFIVISFGLPRDNKI